MAEFLSFALVWIVFMGIVVAIALITPKLAPKIDGLLKSIKQKKDIKGKNKNYCDLGGKLKGENEALPEEQAVKTGTEPK